MTVAAVATESVAVTDSEMEQGAVCADEVASATEAASLNETGNAVFADGLSVAVAVSLTAEFTWEEEETASVAVTVSAVLQAKVCKVDTESVTVAVSAMEAAKIFPVAAANEACANAVSPKSILTQLLQLWLQALELEE